MLMKNCVRILVDATGARQEPDPPEIVGGAEDLYVSVDWVGAPPWDVVTLTGFRDGAKGPAISEVYPAALSFKQESGKTPPALALRFPRVSRRTECKYDIVLFRGSALQQIDPVIIIKPWE